MCIQYWSKAIQSEFDQLPRKIHKDSELVLRNDQTNTDNAKKIYLEAWSISQNLQTVFNKKYTQMSSLYVYLCVYIYIYIYIYVSVCVCVCVCVCHFVWC